MGDMSNQKQSQELKKMLREQSFIQPVIKNPFYHKLNFTTRDKLKIAFNSVFLFPLRAVGFLVLLFSAAVVSTIVLFGLPEEELKANPLTGWRKKLKGYLRYLCIGMKLCCGFYYVKVNGKPATKQEAPIFVVAPHSSIFDMFIAYIIGLPCEVTRVENTRIPFVGRIIKALQFIPVTREDSKNRLNVIEEIKKRSDPKNDWPQISMFPEGTCTNRMCLISFKPGAFIPGVPVQPVAIQYKNKFNCVTWTWNTDVSAAKVFFYTLCQFQNYLEVTFLPVYQPNDAEKANPMLYANNVRNKIAQYLGIPVTNHTFEDVRLTLQAEKHSLPFETGLIEFAKIRDKLKLKYETCEDLLETFSYIARKSKGKMTLKEFCEHLDLPISRPIKQVFRLYDRDHNGYIDFREFLIGLSVLSQPANNEETLKKAFHLFDVEDKGYITLSDLKQILHSGFSMKFTDISKLFDKINTKHDGVISFDEFKSFAIKNPEYARVFLSYEESGLEKVYEEEQPSDDDEFEMDKLRQRLNKQDEIEKEKFYLD